MSIAWLSVVKELPKLIKDVGGMVTSSRATKNQLISELKLNLKHYQNCKKTKLGYDALIQMLSNDQIKNARKEGFVFSVIKIGDIESQHVKDIRNQKYIGKNCEWLFFTISDKIEELKTLQKHKNLSEIKDLNIPLQCSNLFYRMKLLAEFIQ